MTNIKLASIKRNQEDKLVKVFQHISLNQGTNITTPCLFLNLVYHHLLQHVKTPKMIKTPPWLTTMAENYKLFFSIIFIFHSSSLRQLSYFEYIFLTSYRMNMIPGLLESQLIGVQRLFHGKISNWKVLESKRLFKVRTECSIFRLGTV